MKKYRVALKRLAGNPTDDEIKKITVWSKPFARYSKRALMEEIFQHYPGWTGGEQLEKIKLFGRPLLKYFKKDLAVWMLYESKRATDDWKSGGIPSWERAMIAGALSSPELPEGL